ncbi:MAG: NADH-quinone oxidoreductase subunit N [Chitinophagales bacterium]
MKTLIYTSVLGVVCMLAEMANLRRFIVPLAVVGLLAIFGANVYSWGTNESYYHNMLMIDNFSIAFSGLILLLGALLVVLAGDFYKSEQAKISDFVAIIVFTLAGAIALVSYGNLAMFFLGLEILSISLYVLAGSKKKELRSNEAGMKYFLMGSFASGVLLFGLALIYGDVSSQIPTVDGIIGRSAFDLERIRFFAANQHPSALFYIGSGMMLIGMLFKVSAAPFHFWAPDVYEGSPTLVTTLMASVAKIAAFAAFYRLLNVSLVLAMPTYAWVLSSITALTILVGNLSALNQDSFKRMLAFSGVSHAGYLMLGIISAYGNTDGAIFYYSLAYGLSTIAAFAVAIVVSNNLRSDKFEAFNGLGKRKPMLAAALTMAMLSMAGIPPFAGFFGKYYIFTEAIKNGHLWLTVFAVVNSIIGVYYYFKVILAMYTKEGNEPEFSINPSYAVVIGICVVLSLVFGVFPSVANLL